MRILVTGGAGYIGSHFCQLASEAGHTPIVFDNLSTGHKEFVQFGPFIEGDIRDTELLTRTLKDQKVEAVVHFAAKALVGESVEHPDLYYSNNTWGTASLLKAMDLAGVRKLVFSSSCATYGVAKHETIGESHPQEPINPYGRSKLQGEEMILDYHRLKKFRVAILRYFNVAGHTLSGKLWEWHEPETHLLPNIAKGLKEKKTFHIWGTDYGTPDGTCIRDYVYVVDLGKAHLAALSELEGRDHLISNVGLGRGYSVKEVFSAFRKVVGRVPEVVESPRRPGDPERLVADGKHFRTWYREPMADLEAMIKSLGLES